MKSFNQSFASKKSYGAKKFIRKFTTNKSRSLSSLKKLLMKTDQTGWHCGSQTRKW